MGNPLPGVEVKIMNEKPTSDKSNVKQYNVICSGDSYSTTVSPGMEHEASHFVSYLILF